MTPVTAGTSASSPYPDQGATTMANQSQTQPDQVQGAIFPPWSASPQAARLDPTQARAKW